MGMPCRHLLSRIVVAADEQRCMSQWWRLSVDGHSGQSFDQISGLCPQISSLISGVWGIREAKTGAEEMAGSMQKTQAPISPLARKFVCFADVM
jgi:hypothetical protein